MVTVRAFIGGGISVLVIVGIFLGLFSNGWVSMKSGDDDYFFEYEMDIGLREVDFTIQDEDMSQSLTFDIDYFANLEKEESEDSYGWDDDPEGMGTTWQDLDSAGFIAYIILWIALGVTFAYLALAVLSGIGLISGKWGLLAGILASILIGSGIAIYEIMLPGESDAGAFPYNGDISRSWTYVMMICVCVAQLVAAGLLIGVKRRKFNFGKSRSPSGYGQYPQGYGQNQGSNQGPPPPPWMAQDQGKMPCPKCGVMIRPGVGGCPMCGWREY